MLPQGKDAGAGGAASLLRCRAMLSPGCLAEWTGHQAWTVLQSGAERGGAGGTGDQERGGIGAGPVPRPKRADGLDGRAVAPVLGARAGGR